MIVELHPGFDPAFPETFHWQFVQEPSLEAAALRICAEIEQDFKTRHRVFTPGLRLALQQIAAVATVERPTHGHGD